MKEHTTIAVDLSKSVFEVAVSREPGRVCQRRQLSRNQMTRFFAQRPPATVLLEACGSSHHWGRQIESLGHRVLLLPPQHTRRYVLRDKTDRADATALLEAHRNEQIAPVPVKTLHQQSLAALHRLRSGWLATRTARLNAIRGLLREMGVSIPQGARRVLPGLSAALSHPSSPIPDALHETLLSAAEEIRELESKIGLVERQLKALARSLPAVARLRTVPGIGLLSSTALVALVGDPSRFPSGRRLASYFGLVPREHSSGPSRHLGAITKRGDAYLRTLLIHGARSLLYAAKRSQQNDRLRRWALTLEQRRGHNRPQSPWPTNSLASPGLSGAATPSINPLRRPPPKRISNQNLPPNASRFEPMNPTVRPTRGQADNMHGHKRPLSTIGSPRASLILARSNHKAPHRGQRYECRRDLPAAGRLTHLNGRA